MHTYTGRLPFRSLAAVPSLASTLIPGGVCQLARSGITAINCKFIEPIEQPRFPRSASCTLCPSRSPQGRPATSQVRGGAASNNRHNDAPRHRPNPGSCGSPISLASRAPLPWNGRWRLARWHERLSKPIGADRDYLPHARVRRDRIDALCEPLVLYCRLMRRVGKGNLRNRVNYSISGMCGSLGVCTGPTGACGKWGSGRSIPSASPRRAS